MTTTTILNLAQSLTAILLIGSVLLQQRGTGLGGTFGGSGNVYRSRRGVEQALFRSTIVLAIIFLGVAVANVLTR